MVVGDFFIGDDNDDLKDIQHDLWFKLNGAWIDHNGFAMDSCTYIFWLARSAFLFNTGENPLFFPDRDKLTLINGFDHRTLQYAHHKIAVFYRWINKNAKKPAFGDGVSYRDWVKRKMNADRLNIPFSESHSHHIYMLDAWKTYLHHEVADLTFGNIPLSEFIVKSVLFANTEEGYIAENFIDNFLTMRYGVEFDGALKIKSEQITRQNNGRRGYIYIMVSPALSQNFLKIGKTTRTPERRAHELSIGTGVPMRFYVAFDILVSDCHLVEKIVHEKLINFRSSSNREFFELPLKEAIQMIHGVSNNYSFGLDLI